MTARKSLVAKAVSELAIIVAGVLIALWVQEWRQSIVDARTEHAYLRRLEADLRADSARFAGRIDAEARTRRSAQEAMRFVTDGWTAGADTAAVLESFNRAGFINFVRPQSTTWDDLVSTGNIGLLSDAELRQSLGAYYQSRTLQTLQEMDDSRKEQIWYRYWPALESHFPLGFLDRFSGLARYGDMPAAGSEKGPEPSGTRIDFRGLRSDPRIVTGLKEAADLAAVYGGGLRHLVDENRGVLSKVRTAQGGEP
jgi:hypothetical protein